VGGRGDSCYFPRDLGRGSYGGDVHCFQQYLSARGYLLEEPTGFFGERTAAAAKRWQASPPKSLPIKVSVSAFTAPHQP